LAHRLSAEKLAGSPRGITTEAELIGLRRGRDGLKASFQRIRDDYHRQLETITRTPIARTAEAWVNLMRSLPEKYEYERLEPARDLDGRKVRGSVRIRTNATALAAARTRILDARRELMAMQHCSLPQIRALIEKFEREYALFDLSILEAEEVSETRAADLLPDHRNPPSVHAGELFHDLGCASVFVKPAPASTQIARLAGRISKLEASK
jgi:hypothetical protein